MCFVRACVVGVVEEPHLVSEWADAVSVMNALSWVECFGELHVVLVVICFVSSLSSVSEQFGCSSKSVCMQFEVSQQCVYAYVCMSFSKRLMPRTLE